MSGADAITVSGGTLAITGEGSVTAGSNGCDAVFVTGGSVSVQSGTFYGANSSIHTNGGSATITGGYFDTKVENTRGTLTITDGHFKQSPVGCETPAGMALGEPDGSGYSTFVPAALQIGDVIYETVASVADALPDYIEADGNTLKLKQNYTLPAAGAITVIGEGITLDLNGFTLTLASEAAYGMTVSSGASLTITDTSPGQGGIITNGYRDYNYQIGVSAGVIYCEGGLTLEHGTISAVREHRYEIAAVTAAGGTFTMTGGRVVSLNEMGEATVSGIYTTGTGKESVLNITGGQIEASGIRTDNNSFRNTSAIYLYGAASCTIGGDAVLTASTSTGADAYAVRVTDNQVPRITSVRITGGQFNGLVSDFKSFSISGGTFQNDVTLGLAAGYECVVQGENYVVQQIPAGSAVAQIGGQDYPSLSAAIAAVPENGTQTTITLLRSTTETFSVGANQNILLNLGENTVYSLSPHTVAQGGTLTVEGTTGALYGYDELVTNDGSFTLSSGSLTGVGSGQNLFAVTNNGTMQMTGGKLAAVTSGVCNNGTLTMTGGEIAVTSSSQADGIVNYGTLSVSNAAVSSEQNRAIVSRVQGSAQPSVTLSGANLSSDGPALLLEKADFSADGTQAVEITSSTLSGSYTLIDMDASANVTINSGSFSSDVNGYLIEKDGGSLTIKGGTFTGEGNTGIISNADGNLTIENGTFSGDGNKEFLSMEGGTGEIYNASVTSGGRSMGIVMEDPYRGDTPPTLTIHNATYNIGTADNSTQLFVNRSSGTLTVKDGSYTARELFHADAENAVITIEGGTYTSTEQRVFYASDGTINVLGGTFNGSQNPDFPLIYLVNGNVDIQKGTFTGKTMISTSNVVRSELSISGGDFTVDQLYDGYFTNMDPSLVTEHTQISGGSYGVDVSSVVAENYSTAKTAGSERPYIVGQYDDETVSSVLGSEPVAKRTLTGSGSAYYSTLADAVGDCPENGTISLMQSTEEELVIGKALVILKNGYTVQNVSAGAGFTATDDGTSYTVTQNFSITGFDEASKTATIQGGSEGGTATVLFAVYDSEGNLLASELQADYSLTAGENTVTTTLDLSQGEEISVMLWNNLTDTVPLCGSYVYELGSAAQ